MSFMETWVEIGCDLCGLASRQSEWSQRTFGKDAERGPMGALKHLECEAREAQKNPTDKSEYADCLLLILDASRRAGMSIRDLLKAAEAKQEINEKRTWAKPTSDEPVFHST